MFDGSSSSPAEHILRRGYVAFFRDDNQLSLDGVKETNKVELRLRSSKADPIRKGVRITRMRSGPPRTIADGGGAVDVVVELVPLFPSLPSHATLAAFSLGNGTWSVWSKPKATDALRQVVALAGLPPDEFALHSLRIGGATYLAAGGASPEVLRNEGRWARKHGLRPYVCNHGMDAEWVSDKLVKAADTL